MYTSFYTDSNYKNELPAPIGDLSFITHIIIDVDGTLTDGSIYYDEHGNELKKFNTKDAAGFFAAKVCKIKILIITGRKCEATFRRMTELQASLIAQEVVDKVKFIREYMYENKISRKNLAYIGDDLNDYNGMKLAGFVGCPADAVAEIKAISDYISTQKGGDGAVRDVIEHILKQRGQWEMAYRCCYKIGI